MHHRTYTQTLGSQAGSICKSVSALKLKFGTTAFIFLLADRPTLWQFSSHHPKMINAFSNYYINIVAKAPPPDETMIRDSRCRPWFQRRLWLGLSATNLPVHFAQTVSIFLGILMSRETTSTTWLNEWSSRALLTRKSRFSATNLSFLTFATIASDDWTRMGENKQNFSYWFQIIFPFSSISRRRCKGGTEAGY